MQRSSVFVSRSSRARRFSRGGWFAESDRHELSIPTPWAAHSVLRPSQDENIWLTEVGGNKIGW